MSISSLEGHLHRFCGGRYHGQVETVTVRLSGMQHIMDLGEAENPPPPATLPG